MSRTTRNGLKTIKLHEKVQGCVADGGTAPAFLLFGWHPSWSTKCCKSGSLTDLDAFVDRDQQVLTDKEDDIEGARRDQPGLLLTDATVSDRASNGDGKYDSDDIKYKGDDGEEGSLVDFIDDEEEEGV